MKWLLAVWIAWYHPSGVVESKTHFTIPFATREACEFARDSAYLSINTSKQQDVDITCLPFEGK